MTTKPVTFTKDAVHKASMASGRIFYSLPQTEQKTRKRDFQTLRALLFAAETAAPKEIPK